MTTMHLLTGLLLAATTTATYVYRPPYKGPAFHLNDLGCWKDTHGRAAVLLEGKASVLDGKYHQRRNAKEKCAKAAYDKGYSIMCVQNGGQCFGSKSTHATFYKHGPSHNCAKDGDGGSWANQCYEINTIWMPTFTSIGCYKDKEDRAIAKLEGRSSQLNGHEYQKRHEAVRKCARLSASLNYYTRSYGVFGVQDGGQCFGGPHIYTPVTECDFGKYGTSDKCGSHGKGGPWANEVYQLTNLDKIRFKNLGCWMDKHHRAIQIAENSNADLTGDYQKREDAIGKCARYAASNGFKVFGVQHGGQCFTAIDAQHTYNKYGKSSKCSSNGKGADWANEVYEIIEKLPCRCH